MQVHESELGAIALNSTGTLLATASKQGTLIRIFQTSGSCEHIMEFRRGLFSVNIYSLAFSYNTDFLCLSSNSGTVHMYNIVDPLKNKKATWQYGFNNVSGDLCVFKIKNCERTFICGFPDSNHVVAITSSGTFQKYVLTANGTCNQEEYELFLDENDKCNF